MTVWNITIEGRPAQVDMPDDFTEEQVTERVTEMAKNRDFDFGMGDFLRKGAQGATLGFSDEMFAGLESLFTDKSYKQARDENRRLLDLASAKNPGLGIASELAGGFATGGVGGARTLAATGLRQGIKAGSKLGAGFGATAGAGYAEELEDVPGGIAAGAALGAGLGAAIPATGYGVGKATQYAKSIFGPTKRQSEEFAKREIVQALRRAGLSMDDVTEQLSKNPHMRFMDLDPELQALALKYRTQGPGGTVAQAEPHLQQQAERIMPAAGEMMGVATTAESTFFQKLASIAQSKRANARPKYEEAYAQPKQYMGNGPESSAEKWRAQLLKGEDGDTITNAARTMMQRDKLNGDLIAGPPGNRWRMMDYEQRALRQIARGFLKNPEKAEQAVPLLKQHAKYVAYLEKHNPALKRARSIWRSNSEDEDAILRGQAVFTKKGMLELEALDTIAGNTKLIPKFKFKNLSQSEQENYRIGAARGILDLLKSKGDTTEVAKLLRTVPKYRDTLKRLAKDEESFNNFMNNVLKPERSMTRIDSILERYGNQIPSNPESANALKQIVGAYTMEQVPGTMGGLATASAVRKPIRKWLENLHQDPHAEAMNPLLWGRTLPPQLQQGAQHQLGQAGGVLSGGIQPVVTPPFIDPLKGILD